MTQDAENAFGGQAALAFGVIHGPPQTFGDLSKSDAAMQMRLWIEEDFRMLHRVISGADEVGHGEVIVVVCRNQHGRAEITDVQEDVKRGEPGGAPDLLDAGKKGRAPNCGSSKIASFRAQDGFLLACGALPLGGRR